MKYFLIICVTLICSKPLVSTLLFNPRKEVTFQFFASSEKSEKTGYEFENGNHKRIPIPKFFDSKKQTFVYIHGYMSKSETQTGHAQSFFDSMQPNCCNFIVLDWTKGNANVLYFPLVKRSRLVSLFSHLFSHLFIIY